MQLVGLCHCLFSASIGDLASKKISNRKKNLAKCLIWRSPLFLYASWKWGQTQNSWSVVTHEIGEHQLTRTSFSLSWSHSRSVCGRFLLFFDKVNHCREQSMFKILGQPKFLDLSLSKRQFIQPQPAVGIYEAFVFLK